MAVEERSNKPQRLKQEYKVGEPLVFFLQQLRPDGTVDVQPQHVTINDIKGGGFFGRVLFPKDKDYVIKTTTPESHLKEFLRYANWGLKEFPSRVSEDAAQLDYLSVNLMHDTLSVFSKGKFSTPGSLGYAELPNGYAQLIEKVSGRGPRFDCGENEYARFKVDQAELAELLYESGFEQGAQVSQDNPLGFPNYWWNDDLNQGIAMDNLAAFRLKPTLGFVKFGFHQDAKDRFYPDNPRGVPYNRVHTALLRQKMEKFKDRFNESQYNRILGNISLYEEKQLEFETKFKPEWAIGNAAKAAALGAGETAYNTGKSLGSKAVNTVGGSVFLLFQKNKELVLKGPRKGFEAGLVSEEEFRTLENALDQHDQKGWKFSPKAKVAALTGLYWTMSRGVNAAELYTYSTLGLPLNTENLSSLAFIEDWEKFAQVAALALAFRVGSGIARYPATLALGHITGMDLRAAARVAAAPLIGDNIAWAAQLNVDNMGKNNLVAHYAVRELISGISKIPWFSLRKKEFTFGGWGTDREAELMQTWGKKIERWIA